MNKNLTIIFFCEECGAKNSIASSKISGQKIVIKCARCDEILNIQDSSIAQVANPRSEKKFGSHMVVKYRQQTIEIDQEHTRVTFGRHEDNDIKLDDYRVSRSHAFIQYRDGKYVLCDQSTNGTYISLQGVKGFILKKDELMLRRNGVIGLGEIVNFKSPEAIRFTITF
ncbi:FHA domain-containing protein [Desulfococcaceae bacterium HSG9]|nr:FHA domain-containing protein [Desulfococcaceae bacterium HSG9]